MQDAGWHGPFLGLWGGWWIAQPRRCSTNCYIPLGISYLTWNRLQGWERLGYQWIWILKLSGFDARSNYLTAVVGVFFQNRLHILHCIAFHLGIDHHRLSVARAIEAMHVSGYSATLGCWWFSRKCLGWIQGWRWDWRGFLLTLSWEDPSPEALWERHSSVSALRHVKKSQRVKCTKLRHHKHLVKFPNSAKFFSKSQTNTAYQG